MRMNKYIKLIRDNVNLKGYSNSKGFLGFFERIGQYDEALEIKATSMVLKTLGSNNLIPVISSLTLGKNLERIAQRNDLNINNFARDIKLLHKFNIVHLYEYFDKSGYVNNPTDIQAMDNKLNEFENDFSVIMISRHELEEILCIILKYCYCFIGHSFIILDNLKVISYPHQDETGFGFISYEKRYNKKEKEFIKLFANKDFRFITYDDIEKNRIARG